MGVFTQPELTPKPVLEPSSFDVLRDLYASKLVNQEANPYGYDPSQGQSQASLYTGNGRGTFDPYSGNYGPNPQSYQNPGSMAGPSQGGGGMYGFNPSAAMGGMSGAMGGMGGGAKQGGGMDSGRQALMAYIMELMKGAGGQGLQGPKPPMMPGQGQGSPMGMDGYSLNGQITQNGSAFDGQCIGHDAAPSQGNPGNPSWMDTSARAGNPALATPLGLGESVGSRLGMQQYTDPGGRSRYADPSQAGRIEGTNVHGQGAVDSSGRLQQMFFAPSQGQATMPNQQLGMGSMGPRPTDPALAGAWGQIAGAHPTPNTFQQSASAPGPGQRGTPVIANRSPVPPQVVPRPSTPQGGGGLAAPWPTEGMNQTGPQGFSGGAWGGWGGGGGSNQGLIQALMAGGGGGGMGQGGGMGMMKRKRPIGMDSPYMFQRGPMAPLGMDGQRNMLNYRSPYRGGR